MHTNQIATKSLCLFSCELAVTIATHHVVSGTWWLLPGGDTTIVVRVWLASFGADAIQPLSPVHECRLH